MLHASGNGFIMYLASPGRVRVRERSGRPRGDAGHWHGAEAASGRRSEPERIDSADSREERSTERVGPLPQAGRAERKHLCMCNLCAPTSILILNKACTGTHPTNVTLRRRHPRRHSGLHQNLPRRTRHLWPRHMCVRLWFRKDMYRRHDKATTHFQTRTWVLTVRCGWERTGRSSAVSIVPGRLSSSLDTTLRNNRSAGLRQKGATCSWGGDLETGVVTPGPRHSSAAASHAMAHDACRRGRYSSFLHIDFAQRSIALSLQGATANRRVRRSSLRMAGRLGCLSSPTPPMRAQANPLALEM